MNGELLPVWDRSWKEVWLPLSKSAPDDLFMELLGELARPPEAPSAPAMPPPSAFDVGGILVDPAAIAARQQYEDETVAYNEQRNEFETALSSGVQAKLFFRKLVGGVASEAHAVAFLESTYTALVGYDDQKLSARYRNLVNKFINRFSLRYELRGDFTLHATIPGVFTKLISEVRRLAAADVHLADLLSEFEQAFADLRTDHTQARIKTSLHKQFNLLEALGQKCPGVTEATLGAMCNQLDWPHVTIKEVGKKLYGFRSDYPGLGHGGSGNSALRPLEMKDFVSLSLMLASLTPYLAYGMDFDRCYSA